MAILISAKDKASASSEGLVRFATAAEAAAGLRSDIAMSPALVKSQLDSLLDGAPEALDTLNELAAAINDDAAFFTTVSADITNLQDQINSLSGGGASNQAEVDRIEAGVGLGSTGLYVSRSGTNFLDSATDIVGEITALDTQLKTTQDDLDTAEASIVVNAASIATNTTNITSNDSDISALDTRVTSLEGTASNQAELDATQASVGLNANGTLGSYANNNFYSASATIKAAVAGVDAQAKDNETDITAQGVRITALESGGSLSALQSEVDANQSSIGLSTAGAYVSRSGTNYLDSASTIVGEIGLLDAQVRTNEQDITAIETQITSIVSEGDTSEAAIVALQSELDATQTGAGLSGAGSYTAPGVSNYLSGASTLKAADSLLDTQIKTNETAIATKAASSVTTALQTEVDAIESGIGLGSDGSYTAIVSANYATSSTLKGAVDQLDVQLKQTQDDLEIAEARSLSNATAITNNDSDIAALNTLQTAQEAAIGLSTAGAYVGRSGSNYLDSASSVVGEATALDAQVKTNETAIATKASSSSVSTLQSEVDTSQASLGLNANGSISYSITPNFFGASSTLKAAVEALDPEIATNAGDILGNANQITAQIALNNTQEAAIGLSTSGTYVSRSGTNFLDSASSIVGEITALDTAVQANVSSLATKATAVQLSALDLRVTNAESGLSSNDTEIQALEDLADTHETNIGLDNDGGYTAISGANYATSGVSIKAAITQLDTQLKTTQDEVDAEETARASGDSANAAAINTVEASVGLAANGSLSISGTNFLNSSSTIVGALSTLDTNQKLLSDIRTNMIASLGLSTTGEKNNYANTNFIDNAEDVIEAIEALDRQVKTNETDISSVSGGSISALQTEVDAIETAAGLASGGTYVAHSGSNFMDAASTMKGAREALDARLKTAVDDLDTAEAAIVSNDTDITALQTRATSLEQRCGGMMRNNVSTQSAIMDNSPIIRGHAGPFAYNLGQSYLDGFGAGGFGFDFIMYGTSAERCSDIHFDVQSNGDAVFTGHTASPADL